LSRFVLLPGQRHDSIGVEPLITGVGFDALIADKAFDQDALRATLNERGALAVIPAKADRKTPIPHDPEMYKWRHLIENFFQRLKESSAGSPLDTTRPTPASPLRSTSLPPSLPSNECLQTIKDTPTIFQLLSCENRKSSYIVAVVRKRRRA
jgi:transposase